MDNYAKRSKKMKKKMRIGSFAILAAMIFISVGLSGQTVNASDDTEGLVKTGDIIPAFLIPAPKSNAHRKYLGLGKEDNFKPAELKAKVVVIEVLNLY